MENAHSFPGENIVGLLADPGYVTNDAIAVVITRHTLVLDTLDALPLRAHALHPAGIVVVAPLAIGDAEALDALVVVADGPAGAALVAEALLAFGGLRGAVPVIAEKTFSADKASDPCHFGALLCDCALMTLFETDALAVDALHAAVAGGARGAGVAGVVLCAALVGLVVADSKTGAVVGGKAVGIDSAVGPVVVGGANAVGTVKGHLAALLPGFVTEAGPVTKEVAVAFGAGCYAGKGAFGLVIVLLGLRKNGPCGHKK